MNFTDKITTQILEHKDVNVDGVRLVFILTLDYTEPRYEQTVFYFKFFILNLSEKDLYGFPNEPGVVNQPIINWRVVYEDFSTADSLVVKGRALSDVTAAFYSTYNMFTDDPEAYSLGSTVHVKALAKNFKKCYENFKDLSKVCKSTSEW